METDSNYKKYDLSKKISKYIDVHLLVKILDHLSTTNIYSTESISKAKIKAYYQTKMISPIREIYENLDTPIPEEVDEYELKYEEEHDELVQCNVNTLEVLGDDTLIEELKSLNNGDNFSLKLFSRFPELNEEDTLPNLFNYIRILFDMGRYDHVRVCLLYMMKILHYADPLYFSVSWGLAISSILIEEWSEAANHLQFVMENSESYNQNKKNMDILVNDLWIIHASVFVYFRLSNGREQFTDKILDKPLYMNAMQNCCPYMFRYYAFTVVSSNKRNAIKDLVKILEAEREIYSDPITEFVLALFSDFDFDSARKNLDECKKIFEIDYFLCEDSFPSAYDDFVNGARRLLFEVFSRIHKIISLQMLSEWLNLDLDDAERWVVSLLKRENVKIDSKKGIIIIGNKDTSFYSNLISKTKLLAFKSQVMYLELKNRVTSLSGEYN
ncbi:hypothetical protein A3Q56_00259 [Intoshia linei]|uniref:Eukaryotic translation initiation factor 3 subunit E n=1 Tax=Intoshia linei TaxID=1819745 RepID=A0A177BCC6_9BILA|nr:hypothetical protein A3Q56_00259 [Intoshia linei]